MIEFLSIHLGTILVGLLVLIGVTGAIIQLIRNKKKGKCTGCDIGCGSCPSQSSCNTK